MKKILLITLSLASFIMRSQMALNHQWSFNAQNTTAQGGNVDNRGVVLDASGNIYVTGFFNNTADFDPSASVSYLQANGNQDIYLAKYSPAGALIWANKIGGSGNDNALGIAIDNAANVYITGTFNSTVDFDPSAAVQNRTANGNNPDIFVAKYNTNGNYVFAAVAGGTLTDNGNAVSVTSSNVYVTGAFLSVVDFDPSAAVQTLTATPGGSSDVFIWKLDLSGNYVNAIGFGGTISDIGNSIVADASNNVLVTGSFQGTADFDPSASTQNLVSAGSSDIYVAKYNSALSYVYAIGMGGNGNDVANSMAIDASGNTYLTGAFSSTVADFDPSAATAAVANTAVATYFTSDMFYAKYNSTGGYVYAYGIGGIGSELGRRIALDGSSNVFITGQFGDVTDFDPSAASQTLAPFPATSDLFMAKYDASGNYGFAYGFGDAGSDAGFGIFVDGSNNIYLTGTYYQTVDFDQSASTSTLAAGPSFGNTFFAKYNSLASFQFVKGIGEVTGGGLSETSQCILRDASGNIYVGGYFNGVVDFDPSASTQTLASQGASDIFIAKYSAAGAYIWAKSVGGTGTEIIGNGQKGNGMKLDASNNIYLTGAFNSTLCDFDPSASTATLGTIGNFDVFFAKYDVNGNYVYATSFGGTGDDRGLEVTVDASGNSYVGGYITGSVDFDPSASTTSLTSAGGTDGFFAKYNTTGGFVHAELIGGTSGDQVQTIELDASNNIIVGGYYLATADFDPSATTVNMTAVNSFDAFFAKYTNAGVYIFAKSIGGTGQDMCSDLTIDASGNIYLTGDFANTNADFDPSVALANLSNLGSSDVYFAKYDANGNYLFAKAISGTTGEFAGNIVLDAANNIYIAGSTSGTTDFDPSAATLFQTTNGGSDSYLAKYNSSGNVVFAKVLGGSSVDVGYGIATDGAGTIYFTGTFNNLVDFDLTNAVSTIMSSNSQDLFVVKYTECTAVTSTIQGQTNVLCNSFATGTSTISASGGSGFTYTWMPSGGNSTIAINLAAGNYSFVAENSCGSKSTQTINISQPPAITLTANTSNTAVCAPNTATLSSSATGGTGAFTYSWTNIGSNSVVVVSPSTNTTYTLNVTDANNCVSSATLAVSVTPGPTVTAISSNSAICSGSSATLTASGANTYSWSTTSTNTVIVDSPTSTTIYTVTGTDVNSCSTDATVSVVVNPNPTINAISSVSVLCTGQAATITASGAATYTWSTSSNNTSIVVSPTVNTTYTVNGTDANGCTNVSMITQSVSSCTGLNKQVANSIFISVYPNPTNGIFTLNVGSYSQLSKANIYNSIGQLVKTLSINGLTTEMDIIDLKAGIYFIKLDENGFESGHFKIIKD